MVEEFHFVLEHVALQRGDTTVLRDVSMEVPAGTCTGLTGRSGSGKSTLLRLLTRLTDPDSGEISFLGSRLPAWDVLELRKRVQLVAQSPVLLAETVAEEVAVGSGPLDEAHVAELLVRVGLRADLAGRATTGLSGGEAQRLCLARALAMEPDVLLLDEPAAALDAESATAIEDAVRRSIDEGATVLLVSHAAEQVRRLADHAVVLENGAITQSGAPTTLPYLEEDAS